jgi:succinate-semialdehyde dehydrogenase/glutarate-semialdehyde dehydrogenase
VNRALVSIDPARGELVRTWAELGDGQLEERLAGAHAAARTWGAGPSAARAEVLERAAALFRARSEALALGMAEEMGKPLAQGRAEVEKCALGCEFYARHGAAWLAVERPEQLPP